MMKVVLLVVLALLGVVVQEGASMTVSQQEASDLPRELQPIVRGGSFFDDMAVERLRSIHKELRDLGQLETHDHDDHPEEVFIMAKLRDPDSSMVDLDVKRQQEEEEEEKEAATAQAGVQSTREAMRSFLRQQTLQRQRQVLEGEELEEGQPRGTVNTSKEFMDIYEKELESFFKNFMSAMLQAEIGGVSIENRSEEDRKYPETFPSNPAGDRTNTVVSP
ncbi:uncharacterized protein [Cherax quadricarinatus]|uniref:uncharacterized protein n=1 Tax=Cherax quadricarinatus TaxID=27406 RepID=UPI0023795636|nr:uncharacterized protein LOC128686866 [Cherax quadricarinatus]